MHILKKILIISITSFAIKKFINIFICNGIYLEENYIHILYILT